MRPTLAGTTLPPSAVHALIEIGAREPVTAIELCEILLLEKSSVSRMLRKLVESGDVAEMPDARDGRAKLLRLTAKGRKALPAIDAFADAQVRDALARLPDDASARILDGLSTYAEALAAGRAGHLQPTPTPAPIAIEPGYGPGIIGRIVEMHARHYSGTVGFGLAFERKVAADLAEFATRLDQPCNRLWRAVRAGEVVGGIAIDGQDLGPGRAHLRWFIVGDGLRGRGVGRRLLSEAVAFCDARGFAEIHLWTLRGLEAARHLYEQQGFALAESFSGTQWGRQADEQRFVRLNPAAGRCASASPEERRSPSPGRR